MHYIIPPHSPHNYLFFNLTICQWLALAIYFPMTSSEDISQQTLSHRQHEDDLSALTLGPHKKAWVIILLVSWDFMTLMTCFLFSHHTDPLVSYGHHFGHTVHALCNVQTLITKGLLRNMWCSHANITYLPSSWIWSQGLKIAFYRKTPMRMLLWLQRQYVSCLKNCLHF